MKTMFTAANLGMDCCVILQLKDRKKAIRFDHHLLDLFRHNNSWVS